MYMYLSREKWNSALARCVATLGVLVVVISGAGFVSAAAPMYHYTYLPFLSGDSMGYPTAINNSGTAVGFSSGSSFTYHALVYSNGTPTNLNGASGASEASAEGAYAAAINDNGAIAGWEYPTSSNNECGFLYSGGTTTLLPGANFEVSGLNNAGQVVGFAGGAAIYSGGVTTVVGTGNFAAINNSGQAVGWHNFGTGQEPALYSVSGGTWLDLGMPSGYYGAIDVEANAISNNGQIAGAVSDGSSLHPVIWTISGGAVTSTTVLSATGDANEDGTVNGSDLNIVLSNYNRTGMSWLQGDFDGNGTVNGADLNAVLSNYNQVAWVEGAGAAAVPEPSTLLLAAAGLLGLLCCRRRKREGSTVG